MLLMGNRTSLLPELPSSARGEGGAYKNVDNGEDRCVYSRLTAVKMRRERMRERER